MKIGTVKWYNLQKGYGFIHPDDGTPNIYVDLSVVKKAGMSDLKEGQRVSVDIHQDERTGNIIARSLEGIEEKTRSSPSVRGFDSGRDCTEARPPDLAARVARRLSCFIGSVQGDRLRPLQN